jgi:hypothetical protein
LSFVLDNQVFELWMDGADAALPWLQQAVANGEWTFLWPEYFNLPERMSTDPHSARAATGAEAAA